METILKLLMENPDTMKVTFHSYVEKYKPLIYSILQEFMEIYKDFSNNQEYPQIRAKIKKNQYDAYVAAGFNEDQALALMINDNIQLIKNIKQISSNAKSSSSKNKA